MFAAAMLQRNILWCEYWIVMPTFYCNYFFLLGTRGPLTLGGPWTLPTLPTPLLRHCLSPFCWAVIYITRCCISSVLARFLVFLLDKCAYSRTFKEELWISVRVECCLWIALNETLARSPLRGASGDTSVITLAVSGHYLPYTVRLATLC